MERLRQGITPYTRYVRSENERIDKTETILARLRQRLSALRAQSGGGEVGLLAEIDLEKVQAR